MRDFQGQLCFTNPVIMPLKILIVLAMFSWDCQQAEAFKSEYAFYGKPKIVPGAPQEVKGATGKEESQSIPGCIFAFKHYRCCWAIVQIHFFQLSL